MIYLIGGPPRCGKTTLAKALSKKLGIPWISCDTLEVVSSEYVSFNQWRKMHPYSLLRKKYKTNDRFYRVLPTRMIVNVLKRQARPTFPAIEAVAICEIKDGNDYIIEGYHVDPAFVSCLMKKYGAKNFKAVFLGKKDAEKFAQDVHKSTTPNDWLLRATKREETFLKVGQMVALYSNYFEREARKYGFPMILMDEQFEKQIDSILKSFIL
ncbi:MAG TPA: AAA family ATPase [Patescibacteria group bacterium]|nr:AAA family ATPase [Patescibacteria group bacterium]